ncbi:MAG TPA: hypothetical protein VLI39_15130 [Sedimentisphaerales bacterium]|nr:hypothetical protein [Sedimentisphaerales bacterium]
MRKLRILAAVLMLESVASLASAQEFSDNFGSSGFCVLFMVGYATSS